MKKTWNEQNRKKHTNQENKHGKNIKKHYSTTGYWRKDKRGDRSDKKPRKKKTYEAIEDLKDRKLYSHLKEEALCGELALEETLDLS